MKRNFIFILVCIAMFACKREPSTTNTSGTTATETTGVTATNTAPTTTAAVTSTAPLSAADKDFVMKVAEGGMLEVDLGQLAAAKAMSQDVKDFGNRMVTDHGKANDELKAIAAGKGLTVPTQPGDEEKKLSNELSQKSGAAFDKAYIAEMIKGHDMVAKNLDKASKELTDPDLKAFVAKTLPVVQDHLNMAKQIDSKLK